MKMRSRAEVARRGHSPEVGGSTPPSATKKEAQYEAEGVCSFLPRPHA